MRFPNLLEYNKLRRGDNTVKIDQLISFHFSAMINILAVVGVKQVIFPLYEYSGLTLVYQVSMNKSVYFFNEFPYRITNK